MVQQEIRAVNLNPFTRFVCVTVSLSVNLTGSRRKGKQYIGGGNYCLREKGKVKIRNGLVHMVLNGCLSTEKGMEVGKGRGGEEGRETHGLNFETGKR